MAGAANRGACSWGLLLLELTPPRSAGSQGTRLEAHMLIGGQKVKKRKEKQAQWKQTVFLRSELLLTRIIFF